MPETKNKDLWDVVIVGGGPAGCNAAIVLARCCRRVLLIDEGKQRNLSSIGMHNYLTRDGIVPGDYLKMAHQELDHYKINITKGRVVKARALAQYGFEVIDNNGNIHLCRRLLLATGVTDNVPDIPGMRELWGNGVYHCPVCDGWECRDTVIAIYSKAINGFGMALAMRELSKHIILFTDGARYLRAKQRTQLEGREIGVNSNSIHSLYSIDNKLKGIKLQNGDIVPCDSLFVNNGHKVNDELLTQLDCNVTGKGAALTNRHQQTNIPGVYVAGDASYDMHLVVVAAAEGAKAAVSIHNDLLKVDNEM